MPCTFPNYFVNASHGNRYKVLCKQQSPSWAQRVTHVIIWAAQVVLDHLAKPLAFGCLNSSQSLLPQPP